MGPPVDDTCFRGICSGALVRGDVSLVEVEGKVAALKFRAHAFYAGSLVEAHCTEYLMVT